MRDRRVLHASVFFHRIVSTKCPPYLYNKIRYRSDVHNINIRRKSIITPPAHTTTLYERSFTYNIAKVYNSIPARIEVCSLPGFKYEMKKLFLSKR